MKGPRSNLLVLLAIDAILSFSLVAGLFQYVESRHGHPAHRIELERAGAISMSALQMIAHIQREERSAFWLGPQPNARYAADDLDPRRLMITYLLPGDDLYAADQSKMTVQTFQNWNTFENAMHLNLETPNMQRYETSRGNAVISDSARMETEIVTFPNDPSVVVIYYTHAASPHDMLVNADNLVQIL